MGDQLTGYWELAVAPFNSPDEETQTSFPFSSASFDTLGRPHEAQSFLRMDSRPLLLPATSRLVGEPLWPEPPLLFRAQPHSGNYLLSRLCDNIGIKPKFVGFRRGSNLGCLSVVEQMDELLSLEWNFESSERESVEPLRKSAVQIGPSESFQTPPEDFFRDYSNILDETAVEETSELKFSKQPIKKVSEISLMPAPDTIRLIWEIERDRRNYFSAEMEEGQSRLHQLYSVFSDTTHSPSQRSCRPSSYVTGKSSFIVDPPHHPEPEVPVLEGGDTFTMLDARSEDIMANVVATSSTSNPSHTSLLSPTPSIGGALCSAEHEWKPYKALSSAGFDVAERTRCTTQHEWSVNLSLDTNANLEPQPRFRSDTELKYEEGKFMTGYAGQTPYNYYSVIASTISNPESTVSEGLFGQDVGEGENISLISSENPLEDLYVTTSSIDEAEGVLISCYLGDEILDPDVECALRFAAFASRKPENSDSNDGS